MKKIIAIMLVILAVLSLTACSSSRDAQEQTTQTEYKPTLEVDTEKKGIIAENPTPIDSGKITIGKREYTFPMLVSELTEDGWYFDENARERLTEMELVGGRATESLSDFNLYHNDYAGGLRLMLLGVYNEGSSPDEICNCYVGAMAINSTMAVNPEEIDIILPGGITFQSTVADVISVYGDEKTHPYFLGAKLEGNSAEYRGEHFNVSFTFEQDGRINYLQYSKYVNLE